MLQSPPPLRQEERMSCHATRRVVLASLLLVALQARAITDSDVPTIWDSAALGDWATPVATLNVRPAHFTPTEYYAAPSTNLRTYPVYRPDKEPPGYWESLQHKKPEPLVNGSRIHTKADWIAAGERAFRELDDPSTRSNDPALIAMARDPKSFDQIAGLADGTLHEPRWVVTDKGVMLTNLACVTCHFSVTADRQIHYATPITIAPGLGPVSLAPVFRELGRRAQRSFAPATPDGVKIMFLAPWVPGDDTERLDRLLARPAAVASIFTSPHGVIARPNGSPFYGARLPDLHLL